MKRALKIAAWVLLGVAVLALAGFLFWALTPLGPEDVALRALQGTEAVSVERAPEGFVFSPRSVEPTVGLVLYPGGRVDARSYAPIASAVASYGYLVVVPRVHLNLAVLEPNAAADVIEAHPEIASWAVGGHSLGGAMAAQYASKNAARLDGLVLLAAYANPPSDLSGSDLSVFDVYGDRDGVLSMENHEAGSALLPPGTKALVLEGGNHAQFGDYGPQPGDNPATITAAEQWRVTAREIAATLRDGAE